VHFNEWPKTRKPVLPEERLCKPALLPPMLAIAGKQPLSENECDKSRPLKLGALQDVLDVVRVIEEVRATDRTLILNGVSVPARHSKQKLKRILWLGARIDDNGSAIHADFLREPASPGA
jgi:hypothetical protein